MKKVKLWIHTDVSGTWLYSNKPHRLAGTEHWAGDLLSPVTPDLRRHLGIAKTTEPIEIVVKIDPKFLEAGEQKEKKKAKLVISIDFDGTIVHEKYPRIGKFRFGARRVIKWIQSRGHKIILNTCRTDFEDKEKLHLTNAKRFLNLAGIFFDAYNENLPELIEQYEGDCRKISADWYFDDKAGFWGWWTVPFIILWLERRKAKK